VTEYVGGYEDWHKQIEQLPDPSPPKSASATPTASKAASKSAPRKLSYNEQRELADLPGRIEMLEAEQHQLTAKMEDHAFYQQGGEVITQAVNRLQELHEEISRAYQRWLELEL
jgi:ATP-binding cassette subfamily F protein uup